MSNRFSVRFSIGMTLSLFSCSLNAAILTDGDAYLNEDILVAQSSGNGRLELTAPTSITEGGGIYVAKSAHYSGNVLIDGGSFASHDELLIGENGRGRLEIIGGGQVTNFSGSALTIGQAAEAEGLVSVSGPGSVLNMPYSDAQIGYIGNGTLELNSGGRAIHDVASIGWVDPETDASPGYGLATIQGTGSHWDLGRLNVDNGTINIQDGGLLETGFVLIGNEEGRGQVIVEGTGSRLQGSQYVALRDGSLVVRDSAAMTANRLLAVGDSTSFLAEGLGTHVEFDGLRIDGGPLGTSLVSIGQGAYLKTGHNTELGTRPGSSGKIVIDGLGTRWHSTDSSIQLGAQGTAEMIIRNGALVTHYAAQLGSREQGLGLVKVLGQGTQWQVRYLKLGHYGSGQLLVADGASIFLTEAGSMGIGPQYQLQMENGSVSSASGPFSGVFNSGTIFGSGDFFTEVRNSESANIRVAAHQRMFFGRSLENAGGRIEIANSEIAVTGTLSNTTDGMIALDNGTLFHSPNRGASNYLENEAQIVSLAGQSRIHGNLLNGDSGSVLVTSASHAVFYDHVENLGEISVSAGSRATFLGTLSGNGVSGGGTVNLEGTIDPGNALEGMTFAGDVSLGTFSNLDLELNSTSHDKLNILGEVTLGGTLDLTPLEPLADDLSLEILSAQAVLGTFDNLPAMGEDLGFGVVFGGITYHDDAVEVSLLQQSANFNIDGHVDTLDRAVWSIGYGTTSGAGLYDGDATRDGDVDGNDFLAWQQQYQPTSVTSAIGPTVPEPSCLVLGTLLCLGLLCFDRSGAEAGQGLF